MKKLLLPLLLSFGPFVFSQSKLVGFTASGEINAPNAGGMIWQMNTDGSDFQALKNFNIQKPIRPNGAMVIGPDGMGYGLAHGYDFDAGVQVFYQFNFTTKALSVLKVFKDSPWSATLLVGIDGFLYGCRRLSNTSRALCRISYEGEVLENIYEFEFGGSATDMIQTTDGRIILTCEAYGKGPIIIGGFPDGTDWKTMVTFEKDPLGNYMSNLVAKSDGYVYGVTWEYWGMLRFFKILQNGQDFSYFYDAPVPDFGNQISLNIGANEVLCALVQKGSKQVLYQVPTDESNPPFVLFEDGSHGYLWSNLTRDGAGNLYYHTGRLDASAGTQTAYMIKFKNGGSIEAINTLFLDDDQDRLLSILFNPANERLYFWGCNDLSERATMMSCKTDGTSILTEYNLSPGVPGVGAYPKQLIQGSDGKFYGLMDKGGQNGTGMVFSMNPDGGDFLILGHMLPPQLPASWWPEQSVSCFFEGSDGWLYGTSGDGRIFKVDKNGNGFTVLFDELHHRSNFIEHTDGMLYWGGNTLMRMAKDGSNKTPVFANFISPFTTYDFCELFSLPSGKIAGAGSYTEDANCLDYYTYGLSFSFDLSNQTLHKIGNYYAQCSNTALGKDGNLYYGKGKYNPETNTINQYNLACAFFPDVPTNNQVSVPALEGNNGFIFGQKSTYSSNDGRWFPNAWSPESGACEMSTAWNHGMGYRGQFAFEMNTGSTPTDQPDVSSDGITLAPNPTSFGAQIFIHLNAPTQVSIIVTDMLGRGVYEENTKAIVGENIFEIPVKALSSKGFYQVVLKTEEGIWSRMLLVD